MSGWDVFGWVIVAGTTLLRFAIAVGLVALLVSVVRRARGNGPVTHSS